MPRLLISRFIALHALILGSTLLVATGATAHANEKDAKDLFSKLDTNGDGQIELSEVPEAKQSLFKRLIRTADADEDGSLDAKEFAKGIQPTRAPRPLEKKQPSEIPGAAQFKKMIAELDANGDGKIVASEVPKKRAKIHQQFLDRADQDKDGILTKREINRAGPQLIRLVTRNQRTKGQGNGKMMNQRRGGEKLFRRWDTDQDGKIVLEEIPKPRQDGFERLLKRVDRNNDQALNRKEFLAAFAIMNRAAANRQMEQKGNKKKRGKRD